MKKGLPAIILLLILLAASAQAEDRIYVLVTCRNLPMGVIRHNNNPAFASMLDRAALGLMNNRTAGRSLFQNCAATIAAGNRAGVHIRSDKAPGFDTPSPFALSSLEGLTDNAFVLTGCIADCNEEILGEKAWAVYARATGTTAHKGAMINVGAARLQMAQKSQLYTAQAGFLANELEKKGVGMAVFGASTIGDIPYRPSYIIGCRSDGTLHAFHMDCLKKDTNSPMGIATDYESIVQNILSLTGSRLVIVEAGDFFRLHSEAGIYSDDSLIQQQDRIRQSFYSFAAALDGALSDSDKTYRLCILSMEQQDQPNALLPVILTGTDLTPGFITSRTTRRTGFISNIDITPDILTFFGITAPASGFTPVIESSGNQKPIDSLAKRANQITLTYQARPIVVISFVVLTGVAAIILLLSLIFYRRLAFWQSTVRTITITVMLIPLAIFISPLLNIYSLPKTAAFYILFSIAVALALRRMKCESLLLIICSVTAGAITADTLTGAYLSKHSLLSYDAMVGARFYGLGNEYAGILLACSMLSIYMLWQRLPHKKFALPAALLSILVIFTIGWPTAGTNFGGMLAAVCGMSVGYLMSFSFKPNAKHLLAAVTAIIILAAAFVLINVNMPESHIGRFFAGSAEGNTSLIFTTLARKLAMNITLMKASRWVFVLICCLVFLIVTLFNPRGFTKKLFDSRKVLNAGFCGLIFGLVVGFAVNDSGVVMMATGIMYLTFSLALMLLNTANEEKTEKTE